MLTNTAAQQNLSQNFTTKTFKTMKHYNIYVKFKGDNILREVQKVTNSVQAITIANNYIKTGHTDEVRVIEIESNIIYTKEGD